MQISKRLEAVANMVTSGCCLADIGTDHAYIPIYLAEAGKIAHAIAMDVNKGPLERAKDHIQMYGLEQQIETRCSDGLAALQKGEADQIVIAGMGGPLTVRILRDGADKLTKDCGLILQPQSEISSVRSYLQENGYCIMEEELILEDGKYYPMMKAVQKDSLAVTEQEKMSDAELRYGPLLMKKRHPILLEYVKREEELNNRILDSLNDQESDTAKERRTMVEYELTLIRQVLDLYDR